MSEGDAGGSLSGAWSGIYNYPRTLPPVPFTAVLIQNGEWITGTTEEISRFGNVRGVTISATLQGRRAGAEVKWLKLYDLRPEHNGVAYEGTINADASEIHGRWLLPGSWSGTFLMIKAPTCAVERTLEKAERR